MRKILLNNTNEKIPLLGQGSYGIFESQKKVQHERWKEVLKRGIELGLTHIDTAEYYGNGYSEKLIGEVISESNRSDLFITTKLLPSRKTESQMFNALNGSLKRLNLDYIDLYLIHWLEKDSSIKDIMHFFENAISEGKTRYIGVSNFNIDQCKEALKYLKSAELATNQVKFNLLNQDLISDLDFYKDNNITITAYTPLAKANLSFRNPDLKKVLTKLSDKYQVSPLQIALAWVINHQNVIAIPRTSNIDHLQENYESVNIELTQKEIKSLYLK